MTHYYDYYNHKLNFPDKPNPYKAPPKHYAPSKAGSKKSTDNVTIAGKEADSSAKTDTQ